MQIEYSIQPGTELSAAFDAVASHAEENGASIHRNDFMDKLPNSPLCGIARSFQWFQDHGKPVWVYVYVGDWAEKDVLAFLNMALATGGGDTVSDYQLVSANPVPEVLQSLFSTEPRARFCVRAMVEIDESQLHQPTGPIFAEMFADKTAHLAGDFFDDELSIDTVQLSQIDDLILDKLRTVSDRSAGQSGYVPERALVGLGCLAGEVILRDARTDARVESAFWKTPESGITRFGLVVEIKMRAGGTVVINPIGKAFKVFEYGDGESLEFLFRATMNVLVADKNPDHSPSGSRVSQIVKAGLARLMNRRS